MTIKLVLLRHGESIWNKEDRFTGWTDVDLSENGIAEAKTAGKTLKENGYVFDIAFTSVLKRAIRTLWLVQDEMDLMWIPVYKSWRLNERHYGALQGLNKAEMAAKVGEEQVYIWRRSYNVQPPALEKTDQRYFRGRRRHVITSSPDVYLFFAYFRGHFRFIQPLQRTIMPFVQTPRFIYRYPHQVHFILNQP